MCHCNRRECNGRCQDAAYKVASAAVVVSGVALLCDGYIRYKDNPNDPKSDGLCEMLVGQILLLTWCGTFVVPYVIICSKVTMNSNSKIMVFNCKV